MFFQKKNSLLAVLFLLYFSFSVNAVNIPNSTIAEQESLQLFYSKNWKQLTTYGESAIKQGYDYFYMRVRVGIAYYEQKKYIKAIKHFEKALKFNSSDALTQEYLYYSYIFAGRSGEARALKSVFSDDLNNYIKPPKNKIVESISTEGGYTTTNLNNQFSTVDLDGADNIYGEANLMKSMTYFNIGINHQISNKISLYHTYSNIQIDFLRDIKFNQKDTTDNYKLTQHDYYIAAAAQWSGFNISPAFHLINVGFAKMNAGYDYSSYKYVVSKQDTSFINYATSLSVSKSIGIATYGISAGFSQLNGLTQLQMGGSVTYFPFANTNLYGTTGFAYLNENSTGRFIESQKIGAKVFSKLWAEGAITYGNLQNYCESNAFVVFNTGDKIMYKYGAALISPISSHIELSLRYDCFARENTYYTMSNTLQITPLTLNYTTQSLIGGIKWTL